jgi:chromosomal replication initiator protein
VAPIQGTNAERLVADLRRLIGPQRWDVWFEGATDFRLADGALTVGVANRFISDYIQAHFAEVLLRASQQALGADVTITYRVQPDLFQQRRQKNLQDAAAAEDQLAGAAAPEAPAGRAAAAAGAARPVFSLDNFVVGPCNRMAYAAARAAVEAPGRDFHPLFIHGACGLGKTHLLHGILAALRDRTGLRAALLSAEQFTNRYLAGMRTGSLDAFRHRYRNLDVLAIDDIHFLAGKPATQEEFLHTFDEFDGPGRLVVLASDAHPREIEAVEQRLISRWVAGLVVRLSAPDADTRRRILAAKAAQLGRPLPPDVLALVADHVQGSVRDLEGALVRIIAYAALLKAPITPDLVRQTIADYGVAAAARTGLPQIETEAAAFFGVTVADIHGDRKSRLVSLARQVAMVLAREMTGLSYTEIAQRMGGKNHTTVLAACRKWQKLVAAGAEIAWPDKSAHRSMSAEALLGHLKERLRR